MATVYSLQDFRNEIIAIAESINEGYTRGLVEFDSEGVLTFKSYIPKISWTEGKTMDDCLYKTRGKLISQSPVLIDVSIDLLPNENKTTESELSVEADDLPF